MDSSFSYLNSPLCSPLFQIEADDLTSDIRAASQLRVENSLTPSEQLHRFLTDPSTTEPRKVRVLDDIELTESSSERPFYDRISFLRHPDLVLESGVIAQAFELSHQICEDLPSLSGPLENANHPIHQSNFKRMYEELFDSVPEMQESHQEYLQSLKTAYELLLQNEEVSQDISALLDETYSPVPPRIGSRPLSEKKLIAMTINDLIRQLKTPNQQDDKIRGIKILIHRLLFPPANFTLEKDFIRFHDSLTAPHYLNILKALEDYMRGKIKNPDLRPLVQAKFDKKPLPDVQIKDSILKAVDTFNRKRPQPNRVYTIRLHPPFKVDKSLMLEKENYKRLADVLLDRFYKKIPRSQLLPESVPALEITALLVAYKSLDDFKFTFGPLLYNLIPFETSRIEIKDRIELMERYFLNVIDFNVEFPEDSWLK